MTIHPTELPPEAENADSGVPSGTCADSRGDALSAPFYSEAPLAARPLGDWDTEDQLRARRVVRSILFWTGEVIACASVFAIPFMLLIIGELIR